MTLGEKLRAAREAKDYSLEYVASCIGTTAQAIYKYEKGIVTNIPMNRLEHLARVLGVTPSYLMGWENNATVVNGIIGNQNSNNTIVVDGNHLGEIEKEILAQCSKMTMPQKTKLLMLAYEMTGEAK